MNPIPRQRLGEIVERFGHDICQDHRRCAALLNDVCSGQYKAERSVLANAVEERVASDLANNGNRVPLDALLAHLSQRLRDNRGLSVDNARWSVESWALALGVVTIEDTSSPATCPSCRIALTIFSEYAGKLLQCKKCGAHARVSADRKNLALENSARVVPPHPLQPSSAIFDTSNDVLPQPHLAPRPTGSQFHRTGTTSVVPQQPQTPPQPTPPLNRRVFRTRPLVRRNASNNWLSATKKLIVSALLGIFFGCWWYGLPASNQKSSGQGTSEVQAAPSLEFGTGEYVLYIDGATRSDASAVGRALKAVGYFDNTGAKSVFLSRSSTEYVVTVVVAPERFNSVGESEISRVAQTIREGISRLAFGEKPFEIVFCDRYLSPLRRFPQP